MNKRRAFHLSIFLATLGVGLAIVAPFALGRPHLLSRLLSVSWTLFVLLGSSAFVSVLAKAGKLQLMQASLGLKLGFTRTLAITLVTDSAFLISPWGAAGYGVNISLLQRAGASWASATTIVGADQAIDLLFFALAIPLAALFAFSRLHGLLPVHDTSLIGSIIGVFILCVAITWAGRRFLMTKAASLCASIPWLAARSAGWRAFRSNLRRQSSILMRQSASRLAALFLLATLQWLLRYGALWLILLELGKPVPLGFVLAAQALVLHAALWTGVPAGGGSSDLALALAFSPWASRADMSVALVLWRFATLYCPLLFGGIAFAALTWRRGRAKTLTAN